MALNYALFLSSKPDIFVHRPGAPAGVGIGATMVNGVPVCDPSIIVAIPTDEFQKYKTEYNAAAGSVTVHTRKDYIDWITEQDAAVDMNALLAANFAALSAQSRPILLAYLATLMNTEGVSKRDFRLALLAVLASNPPHPFDALSVCKLVWQELVDGCIGDPVQTMNTLQDTSVDETTPLATLEKKLAQRLVAQRVANGG